MQEHKVNKLKYKGIGHINLKLATTVNKLHIRDYGKQTAYRDYGKQTAYRDYGKQTAYKRLR